MTTADQIANLLGNDGMNFKAEDGRDLREVVLDSGKLKREENEGASRRYTFADDSVITAHEGAWDIGFVDCWCWRDHAHRDECEAPKRLTHKGHTFELTELSGIGARQRSWSLRCVDLDKGEDASDLDWPGDRAVSDLAGAFLKFFDGGDDNAEAIYFLDEVRNAAAAMGSAKSKAKSAAARANGAKGGRPRKETK